MRPAPALLLVAGWVCACSPVREFQPHIANGGRAVAIAPDPTDDQVLLVASETGGLFRTSNGGVDFTPVSGRATFGASDVVILPWNHSVALATGWRDTRVVSGGGIYRSTGGGTGWLRVALTTPVAACANDLSGQALALEPAAHRVWAGTSCGLAHSEDDGASWTWLPAVPGYNNDPVYAVLAPAPNALKLLTPSGVKVSEDGGATWSLSATGLPNGASGLVHNQIAVSPYDHHHLFRAFNYWVWTQQTDGSWTAQGFRALYLSTDNGTTWGKVLESPGINRPVFVRVTGPTAGNTYTVYFSDGSCGLSRSQVTHGAVPAFGPWTALTLDHCDPAEVAFAADQHTPLLLASDGGVHRTTDGGAHWSLSGADGHGYGALQMTEVTGQLHNTDTKSDLYFGTQDNDVWASHDNGVTWPARRCCEGFFLNVAREWHAPAETRVTGVTCGACGNFIAEQVLANQAGFPNPPNDAGNPRLLKPGAYIQNTTISGLPGSIFALSTNTGGSWASRYGFPEDVRALSQLAGDPADPVVFTAVRKPGVTPGGSEMMGIRRVVDALGTGPPVVGEVSGFGSLGTFPTMFAWYKPYGVDPDDPQHLIVPDVVDEVVKVTRDGGATWQTDQPLTDLITNGGEFRFAWSGFTQISTIAFDPTYPSHILVGTVQQGIMRTFDDGTHWVQIKNSTLLPNISAFYFLNGGDVAVSTYGRGLWLLHDKVGHRPVRHPVPIYQLVEPMIYWMGVLIPLKDIHNPDVCPRCGYVLVRGGRINEVVAASTGEVRLVQIDGGSVMALTLDGQPMETPFEVRTAGGRGRFGGDQRLLDQLKGPSAVKGLYLLGGVLKGYLLSNGDIEPGQLPGRTAMPPHLEISLPSVGGQPLVQLGGAVVLTGRGFDRRYPLEVRYDGAAPSEGVEPRFAGDSSVTFTIRAVGAFGGHTILVRQRTPAGLVQDAVTINIVPVDEEHER